MARTSFQKLEVEVSRLRDLYLISQSAYMEMARLMKSQIRQGEIDPNITWHLNGENSDSTTSTNPYVFIRRIQSQYSRYLRETIFVRLISALEVYSIDVVRDLFLHRQDLFHSNTRIEISQREILSLKTVTELWTKLLNQDLRKLQNQGFREVVKFYDRQLGIDLGRSPVSIKLLQEMHDRRHLLVHRLGNVDEQYRHSYNVSIKNLSVPEDYLLGSMTSILSFAEYIWAEVMRLAENSQTKTSQSNFQIEEITVQTVSPDGAKLINSEYHFFAEDRIVALSDILTSNTFIGEKNVLTLSGPAPLVKAYIKRIKQAIRKGDLILHERELRQIPWKKVKCNLPDTIIEQIARSLPPKPWPKGVHKEIATSLGISNTQASAAIDLILETPKFVSLMEKNNNIA